VVTQVFTINATGAQEFPVPPGGEPGATATGSITLTRNGLTGTTGTMLVNLALNGVTTPLTAWHIHQAAPGVSGPIVIPFGNPEPFRTGNVMAGTVTGLDNAVINNVFNNPAGFYFNLHNVPFPGGTVRDQLRAIPEPGSLALVGTAALGLWLRRRRAK
jgi:hypothetical protein